MSASEQTGESGTESSGPSKGPLFLALINTVAVVSLLAAMAYVMVLYQRPSITEVAERERLEKIHSAPPISTEPGRLDFDRATVNLEPSDTSAASGGPVLMHYVMVRFSLQLRQDTMLETVEPYKPVIMDIVLKQIGSREMHQLNTVQGRYLLKTDILEQLNNMARMQLKMQPPVFTQLYFTEFLVQ